jgi:phosphatidylserine/phosphatidylglycerophosphate/cardiolipin synthase-like enzyme
MPRTDAFSRSASPRTGPPRGQVELVSDDCHFQGVVLNGILKAKTSVAIATADFKAMLVPTADRRRARSIIELFHDLARKGVEVRLLHSGVPSGPALRELRRQLPDRITIRRCPRLHAKAVIVDCRAMYLGSANLTGAGLGAKAPGRRNFEIGVWTQTPALIDAVLERFNGIWEGHACRSCRRHNICPVPLEEPRLTEGETRKGARNH